jgi:hypothetical protein
MDKISGVTLMLLFIFMGTTLTGQSILNSLEEIEDYGSCHNLDYKSSQVDVLQAEEDRVGYFLFDESSIKTESGFDSSEDSDNYWSFSSELSVPVIEQLTLSAKIDETLNSEFGLTLKPLAHSDTREQAEISYKGAVITAEAAGYYAENGALSAALDWMNSIRDLKHMEQAAAVAEIQYNDDKVRYEEGEITLDELQDSLISWSESRIDLSDAQKSFHIAEIALYGELGTSIKNIAVRELRVEDLEKSLAGIKESFDSKMGDPLKSDSYLIAVLDVNRAEANMANTWTYEPDLSTSASLVYDADDYDVPLTVNASVSFTISLDDFQSKKRNIAKEQLQIKISEAEQSRFEAELKFQQVLEAINSTEINSEISRVEYEQAKILLSEAELLQKLGEYSLIDLENSILTLTSSENGLFKALASEYLAWTELKKYF